MVEFRKNVMNANTDMLGKLSLLFTSLDSNFFAWLIPVGIIAALIEGLVLTYICHKNYDWKATLSSFSCKLGQRIVFVLPFAPHYPLYAWAEKNSLMSISATYEEAPKKFILISISLLIGVEFCYYWLHRVTHEVRLFWAHHFAHHSPNQLNLSTSFREGWTSKVNGLLLFYIPLIWIGFKPSQIFAVLTISLFYQFCLHVTWIPKLGFLEYIFNTPSLHRVHHSRNKEYLNANYGSMLIIFDIMFGTYVKEKSELPCEYGLVTPLKSNNPFVIQFKEWAHLAKDLRKAQNISEALKYLFYKPGWRPIDTIITNSKLIQQKQSKVS
jgi:sterol desaturase/sphingolipid hydroxylase (fatty acid hydroxylase superfamily)